MLVLAWGRMHQHHAVHALTSYQNFWKGIVKDMLEQELCRVGAYKQFHRLVNEKKLTHMGPAYFTKLIYFLGSKQNGYIMDQWTAHSMNLLRKCDGYRYYYVHTDNNESIYSAFCEDLEQLAEYLGKEPEETEKLIFSKGGKNSELGE